jgi:hypothetical protein
MDQMIVINIILSFKDYTVKENKDKLDYILNPIYFGDNPIGFFDGAVVGNNLWYWIIFKNLLKHTVRARFAGGTGNNMKAELLGLWGLLLLASYFTIKKMMVAGDSKVTIDWINSKSNLNLIYLNNWKDKIRSLKMDLILSNSCISIDSSTKLQTTYQRWLLKTHQAGFFMKNFLKKLL